MAFAPPQSRPKTASPAAPKPAAVARKPQPGASQVAAAPSPRQSTVVPRAPSAPTSASPLRSAAAGVPIEPAHSPLEREADAVSMKVAAGSPASVPTTRANPTIPGARLLRAPRPGPASVTDPAPAGKPALDPASAGPAAGGAAAQRAMQVPEAGQPIPETTRRTLEARMGADLCGVRVHQGALAEDAARELQARAFTAGEHVWLGSGESADDVALMAHEATHVLQQRESGVAARVMRNTTDSATPEATTAPPVDATQLSEADGRLEPGTGENADTIVFDSISIPGFKLQGHRAALWQRQQGSGVGLQYPRGYNRGEVPDVSQREKWRTEVNTAPLRGILERKEETARADPAAVPETHYFKYRTRGGQESFYFGTLQDIATELTTPTWNRQGDFTQFHVDHVVELQLADYRDGNTTANSLWNYELLEAGTNTNSGNDLKNSINTRIGSFVRATHGQHGANAAELKRRYNLHFREATGGVAPRSVARDKFWQREEIESGAQLDGLVASGPSDFGRADRVRVIGRTAGGLSKSFSWNGGSRAITPPGEERDWLKPFRIRSKLFRTGADDLEADFGTFNVDVPPDHKAFDQIEPQGFDIARVPGARFAGVINKASVRAVMQAQLRAKGFSPIEIDSFDIENDGIQAAGRVVSDIPLLSDADIRWRIQAGEATIYKTFTGPDLPLPPPFVLDACDLTLFASSERGLGAEGRVNFSVRGVGQGSVSAVAATGAAVTFNGDFNFDSRYFDPARVTFSYDASAGSWLGAGEIGLKPDTVPGIESATGRVTYDGTTIAGSLTVTPKIRAIQQGQLDFRYGQAEGARFDGRLTLSDAIPNVRGGELQVQLSRPPESDAWAFSARGDLESGFAGFTQRLHVEYTDGGFVVEGQGDFERGMLSGSATIGATNYAVDETGARGDAPTDTITAYGSGQVSVALTPWLEATGRIRLLPNGEIELFGELALPDALTVFDERSTERRLASVNLDIPIFGVAVAGQRIGIFATIGGGLDLSAGIGPGQLRDTRLNVTYNPSHEDQTAIHGQARFVVPAHAGLRMFIRGSLGAGIPIVSAQLGLEAGGELGLQGEASAEAAVDWSPGAGLVLDATGAIFVEPRFRFDLTGFAEVTADLLVTEIELYSERWELAAFEVGSSLRFGVEFPLHYQEGEPFDVSWDQVRFTTPDVDVGELMHEVIGHVV